MLHTAQILSFPTPVRARVCMCCQNSFQADGLGKFPGIGSMVDGTDRRISCGSGSAFEGQLFDLSKDVIPVCEDGPICDTCVTTLDQFGKITEAQPMKALTAPSYEIAFLQEGDTKTGYAFMCYDTEAWTIFLSDMSEHFAKADIRVTMSPGADDYPCMIISKGMVQAGTPAERLHIDVLPKAIVFASTA